MRVLVTGGTGLVGRVLVERLLAAGHEVVCMVRRPLATVKSAVHLVRGDLLRPETITFADAGAIDTVFHLGAMLPAEGVSDAAYMTANAAGTAAVMEAGLRQGASRFVYVSSVSVYGAPTDCIIGQDTPPSPHTAYAVSKLAGELCVAFAGRRGAVTTSLRASSIYGPGMSATSVMPRFVEAALRGVPFGWLGAGTRAQDFIHTSDVADACIAAAGTKHSGVYVLASGISTSMKALAELTAAHFPAVRARRMGEHDPEDGRVWAYDVRPIRDALGLPPARRLADGLRDLIDVWRVSVPGDQWWRPC